MTDTQTEPSAQVATPTSLDLAVVAGDGIGPEVVGAGLQVLNAAAGVEVRTTEYDLGAARWHRTGETLTDADLAAIRAHDVILLGAIGDPAVPSGVLERGLLLRLRFELDQYVNLRPATLLPGATSPLSRAVLDRGPVDFVVVREGTEGPYVGNGGAMRVGTPNEIATEVSLNTAFGVHRVVRDAFARAAARPRKKLTLVHKHNVLVHSGHLWRRAVAAVGADFPAVTVDYLHVDAATMVLITDPQRFDVVVTDNLFGDILTDLAAAVTGGIGLAASGNVNPDRTAPSMFEPVHGSAPDIAGTGVADPTATFLSVAMLLAHVGLPEAAGRVQRAVVAALADRPPGGSRPATAEVTAAVLARLAG